MHPTDEAPALTTGSSRGTTCDSAAVAVSLGLNASDPLNEFFDWYAKLRDQQLGP
jgi:hypothetical protein